jgi:hypothetical protein
LILQGGEAAITEISVEHKNRAESRGFESARTLAREVERKVEQAALILRVLFVGAARQVQLEPVPAERFEQRPGAGD